MNQKLKTSKHCGKCGQVGHNRRTCGHSPQTFPTRSTTKTVNVNNSPPLNTHTLTEALNAYPHLWEEKPPPETSHNLTVTKPEADEYTPEDLETLWALRNGKEGLEEGIDGWSSQDTQQLCELVHMIHTAQPNLSPTLWKKFFTHFSIGPKLRFLVCHKNAPTVQIDTTDAINYEIVKTDSSSPFSNTPSQPAVVEQPKIPPVIAEAMCLDELPLVKEELAKKSDLPESVQQLLAQENDPYVLISLAQNMTISSTTCHAIFSKINELAETRSVSKVSDENLKTIRIAIAAHPSIGEEQLVSMIRGEESGKFQHDWEEGVLSGIYQNPHLPKNVLIEQYRKHHARYIENYIKAKKIVDATNFPPESNMGSHAIVQWKTGEKAEVKKLTKSAQLLAYLTQKGQLPREEFMQLFTHPATVKVLNTAGSSTWSSFAGEKLAEALASGVFKKADLTSDDLTRLYTSIHLSGVKPVNFAILSHPNASEKIHTDYYNNHMKGRTLKEMAIAERATAKVVAEKLHKTINSDGKW